jgi:hypothetical protein
VTAPSLVPLRTTDVSTNLHTPIATQLGVPVAVAPAAQTEIIYDIPVPMEFGW